MGTPQSSISTRVSGPFQRPKMAKQIPSFLDLMAYKNTAIVARFQKDFKLSRVKAEELFDDVKRFLWLSSLMDEPIAPPPVVDDGWHTFIIFTRDYMDFCAKYFGGYRHHRPNRPEDALDGGKTIRATSIAVKKFFGGFEKLSKNWAPLQWDIAKCAKCSTPSTACQPAKCS
jgi:hypothetical protein